MSAVFNTRRPVASDGGRRWHGCGSLLVWAVGAVAVACAGFLDDPHLRRVRHMEASSDYPLGPVAGLIALMAGHSGLLQTLRRPARHRLSWGRVLTAWVLALELLFVMAMASIHAPPLLLACPWWLAAVAVGATGLLVGCAWRARRTRRNGP